MERSNALHAEVSISTGLSLSALYASFNINNTRLHLVERLSPSQRFTLHYPNFPAVQKNVFHGASALPIVSLYFQTFCCSLFCSCQRWRSRSTKKTASLFLIAPDRQGVNHFVVFFSPAVKDGDREM